VIKRPPDKAEDGLLRQCIEQIAADRFGGSLSITGIQRRRIRHIGSYDCDEITVHLADGRALGLFLKDYGFSRKSKDCREQRRERELSVYRDLFARAHLGTAEYYGSHWDREQEKFWLFLELVEGVVIKDHHVDQGVLAAGWLGRMQGFFIQHPDYLSGERYLIVHDANFFRSRAEMALRDVAHIAPGSASRLARLVDGYEPLIQVMAAQPQTLVHGAYIPWHIMLDTSCEPVRVCPVDWESVALGATLYDLAIFTDGVESPTRERIWDAYVNVAAQFGVPVPDRPQMRTVIDCFRLHRIFDWLSRGVEKQFSQKKVASLIDQAERLGQLLLV
jgi:hypothetical protein